MVVLTVIPLLVSADNALMNFGHFANSVNEMHLERMARSYLSTRVKTIAKTYNEKFKQITSTSALMGAKLTDFYNTMDVLGQTPLKSTDNSLIWNTESRMFQTRGHEPVAICYWGDYRLTRDIRMEMNMLTHYKPILQMTKLIHEECMATHLISKTGLGYYCSLNPDAMEMVYRLPPPAEFDLRDGEPMTIFTDSPVKEAGTKWTSMYRDDVIDGLMMTATTPVYGKNGKLAAVTGIDFPVDSIVSGLMNTASLNEFTNSKNSFAFLQNRGGEFIAFPKRFQTLFGIDLGLDGFTNSGHVSKVRLQDSSLAALRNIAGKTLSKHPEILEVEIDGNLYLFSLGYLNEVDWHLTLVTPKADLLVSIEKTAAALEQSHRSVWQGFIVYSLLIIIVAVFLSIYATRLFISPIRSFIETTKRIAVSDFSKTLEVNRRDEIGILSKSMNSMVEKLRQSEILKNEYAKKLEADVSQRTDELQQANRELRIIKKDLEKTVENKTKQLKRLNNHLLLTAEKERKTVAMDLHDSVAQTLALSIGKLKSMIESGSVITNEQISEVKAQLDDAIDEIRLLIYQLRPPVLDDFEIDIAIERLVDGYKNHGNCSIEYINEIKEPFQTSRPLRLKIYRITNELIVNILKHSNASKARVKIDVKDKELIMEVWDNGIGFNWEEVKKTNLSSIGLFNISEQVEIQNGSFQVHSQHELGAKIVFSVPLVAQ